MNGSLPRFFLNVRFVFSTLSLVLSASMVSAGELGQPTALQVQPQTVTLRGRHASQQLVVTGRYADGTLRDLTSQCTLGSESVEVAVIDATGFITPKKN